MTGKPMLRYQDIAHNKARVRALTTLEPDEFADLVSVFETCFMERMREYTIDGLPRLNRRYTTYKNSPLPTIEDKLLFILVHMKQNLTQEVQGELFGMVQSDAHKWLQLVRPVLHAAFQRLEVLPARLATLAPDTAVPASDSPLFLP
jgi:Helix-turn-helix of DDE superfamily endonuclease